MFKIATPISTIFTNTTRLGEILDLSDTLEFRDFSKAVPEHAAGLFHCEVSFIEPWSAEEVKRIAGIIRDNQIKLATFHLLSCYVKAPIADGVFQPVGHKMTEEEMIGNAHQNQKNLEAELGYSVPIAVENNNYYASGGYEIVTDPEFINRLVNELNIKLLLDAAHVKVSAVNKGISLRDYYEKFDLDKVVQMHLSRANVVGEICRDTHEVLEDDDWQTAREIMRQCPKLQYATVEYYKDDGKLIEMLKKLKEMQQ